MGCCASIAPDAAEGSVGDVAENYCPEGRHHLEDSCFTDLAAAAPSRQSRSTSVPSRNAAASSAIENAKKRTTSSPPHRQPWVAPEAVDPALQPSAIGVMVGNCYACSRAFNTAAGGYRAFELPCGHQYHEACVEALLREHRACPTCGAAAHPATVPTMQVSRSTLSVELLARRSPSVASRMDDDAGGNRAPGDTAEEDLTASMPGVPAADPSPATMAEEDHEVPAPVPQLPADDVPLVFEPTSVLEEACAVCAGLIRHDAVLLSCGHVFHAGCVDQHLAAHHECPTCRRQQSAIIKGDDTWQ